MKAINADIYSKIEALASGEVTSSPVFHLSSINELIKFITN
jgi:hypothetical protein